MAKVLGYEVQGEEWWEVRLQARPGQARARARKRGCLVNHAQWTLIICYQLSGEQ